MNTVLLITGASAGDTLGGMGRSYKDVFNRVGYDFVEVNLSSAGTVVSDLRSVVRSKQIDFAFSLGAGADLSWTDNAGKVHNLWESIHVPFLSICGNSPAYFFDRHVVRGPNFAMVYGFPEHRTLRSRLPKINGMLGTCRPIMQDIIDRDALDFKAKAAGPLLFLKNGNDPEMLRRSWVAALKPNPLNALQELASHLAANLCDDAANQIDDVVVAYFADRGIDVTGLVKLRLFFIAQLDDYLRRLKSTLIARAVMDFPVQIHGENWGYLDFSGARATYVPHCDYVASRRLIRDSLGLLDMSPNTGLAPHDRALRAFGAYTLCLTNEQEYFRQETPHADAFSFRFEPEAIQARVAEILAHPACSVELGIEVAEAYRTSHTAEDAVGRLIDLAALMRLNQLPTRPAELPEYFVWPPNALP